MTACGPGSDAASAGAAASGRDSDPATARAADQDVPGIGDVVGLASPAADGSGEPYVTTGRSGVWMSWLEQADSARVSLRYARLDGNTWTEPRTIAVSAKFMVNWADFPSIRELGDARLVAYWLERGDGRAAYDILATFSSDGGLTWTTPVRPHSDGTATEHGFVSLFEIDGEPAAAWLDGRGYASAPGQPTSGQMSLRYTTFGPDGAPRPDEALDGRTCDCCQTDAAVTDNGPVVVYRDRSAKEVRDIAITRWLDGSWTGGTEVWHDGWVINGCPVNGPAVAAQGRRVSVAWFTAANDTAKVQVTFSQDGGSVFQPPVRVDLGNPVGRVDVAMAADGSAIVTWLEKVDVGTQVLGRRVYIDGRTSEPTILGESSEARASGFPRMTVDGDRIVLAWTVPGQPSVVRAATASIE
jgi:hypothetical protein